MNQTVVRLPKPPSRRLRFGLRALLIGMALLAIALWLGVAAYKWQKQQSEFQQCYQRFTTRTLFSDADLACIKPYLLEQRLENLDLSDTQISDTAAITLNEFTTLKRLVLNGTRFSDKGLAQLHQSNELSEVFVMFTPITWQGAFGFSEQHPDTSVVVSDGKIWGFAKNGEIALLRFTSNSPISFTEIAKVKQLKGLLCFASPCPLSDSDLAGFSGCSALKTLELQGTKNITDQSVGVILGFKQLQRLSLPSSISPAAAHKIKEGLPQCKEFIYLGHTTASPKNVR